MAEALAPTRTRKPQCQRAYTSWTSEEDDLLESLVNQSQGSPSWSMIAKYFTNKTAPQLAGRWDKVLNPSLKKGSWTREEDQVIVQFVTENGERDWSKLALLLKGRTGKQCRERFKNHLDPNVTRTAWTEEEDLKLIELHSQYGNSWTKISIYFQGRSDNCIKNRWNSTLKKRIERREKGEPLIRKRGRKPKSDLLPRPSPPDYTDALNQQDICSSPVVARPNEPIFSDAIIQPLFLPFGAALTLSHVHSGHAPLLSVTENRMNLLRLLNQTE